MSNPSELPARRLRIIYPGDQYEKQMLAEYTEDGEELKDDENSVSFPVWVSLMDLEGKVQLRKMCKIFDNTRSLSREARKRYMINGIVIHVGETDTEITFKTTLGVDQMELCRGRIPTNLRCTCVDSTTDNGGMSTHERLTAQALTLSEIFCDRRAPEVLPPEPETNVMMLPDSTTN